MKRISALLVCVAVLLVGCSDGGPPPLPRAKVSGTVKLDEKPMQGGEVRFNYSGQPVITMEVTDGAFAGEALVGQNRIDILWEKDGPPHPMEPNTFLKVNAVAAKFSGPNSPFQQVIGDNGNSDLNFEVTSARK